MPKTNGILGIKIGMTRVYDEIGKSTPVTVIEAGPCTVLQKKTISSNGYNAIQIGFVSKKKSRLKKPSIGQMAKIGRDDGFYYIKEFHVADPGIYEAGQEIRLDQVFAIGDKIDVSGSVKGRGFQGVVRRHGFHGGRATHGSMFHRAPGSIGCSAWPSRVVKGKRLPGQMGNNRVTLKNLEIVDIRSDDNILLVKGAVPGAKQGLLHIYTK